MRDKSRLPQDTFHRRDWRTIDFTRDFRVEDVWQLPIEGGAGDLSALARIMTSGGPNRSPDSHIYNALFAVRWWLGRRLGWDRPEQGADRRVPSLRHRLPEDLREGERGPDFTEVPFRSVFRTDTEWVSEIVNGTVHALMHLGWVPTGSGSYTAEMTVLVRTNGWIGRAYMATIRPARLWLVYPPMLRMIGRQWQDHRQARREEERPNGKPSGDTAARRAHTRPPR